MSGESVLIKQNLLMRKFRKAEAVDAGRAKTLAELGIRNSFIFRRMAERGVFIETGDDAYFMDVEAAAEFRVHRRRILFFIFLLIGVALLVIYFVNGGRLK